VDDIGRSLRSPPAAEREGEDGSRRGVLRRWLLGLLWSLKPPRLYGVPAMLAMLAKHYAGLGLPPGALPDPEKALRHPDGLAGICTDMSVPTLRAAYAKGLFPLAHIGPQKWWAPPERMVSFPETVHISKTTRRLLRIKQYEVTFDTADQYEISAEELVSDDYRACQELAGRLRGQAPGLIAPSAALPGTRNAILFGPRVASPYLTTPVSELDIPASITAEDGRPLVALLDLVRFRGDPHPALDASQRGAEFRFAEPNWALTLYGQN